MIVIPKRKPLIQNLNSYYVDIKKLIEHYQGELGSGAAHFKSPIKEAIIFFDKDEILDGIFVDKGDESTGQTAVDRLIDSAGKFNYVINIHRLAPETIYFWASIPATKKVYTNLSTDVTDLEKLASKLKAENWTGFIDITINDSEQSGILFLSNGEILGGSFSWDNSETDALGQNLPLMITKTKKKGAVFNVNRITLHQGRRRILKSTTSQPDGLNGIGALEALLHRFEKAVQAQKRIKTGFATLLRKKFVQKVEQYAFLDPFAAEFEYRDGKIAFYGDATVQEIVQGVTEVVCELAVELQLKDKLTQGLAQWSKTFAKEISAYRIRI